jgi:protein gp37
VFTGDVRTVPERLMEPLKRKKPTTYFVNSMSDLFHEAVPFDFIDRVFAVMALCPQHTFQVLTKRPERMAEYTGDHKVAARIWDACLAMNDEIVRAVPRTIDTRNLDHQCVVWPLPNIWLGTSVENQKAAEERIPHLRRIPARVRGLSLEPLLGPVDLSRLLVATPCWHCGNVDGEAGRCYCGVTIPSEIHWVIAGGESGPQARPMHPDWARGIRDQAQAAGVPYFFKQWGEWLPIDHLSDEEHEALYCPIDEESPIDRRRCRVQTRAVQWHDGKDGYYSIAPGRIGYMVFRVGKHAAGRLLDGREWDEVPEPALTVASGS